MLDVLVEVVVQSLDEFVAAREAGADRVEVCVDLTVGGLTPPTALAEGVVNVAGSVGVHALVRSRAGGYVYAAGEVDEMVDSIVALTEIGVDGVVIGALTPDADVDVATCRRMIDAAGALSVTFHRAFDESRDPIAALDAIVEMGCDRVLTSGQADVAPAGAAMLRRLVEHAAGRIVILAGGGVRVDNVAALIAESGVHEVHFSLAGAGDPTLVIDAARRA